MNVRKQIDKLFTTNTIGILAIVEEQLNEHPDWIDIRGRILSYGNDCRRRALQVMEYDGKD